MSWEEYHYKFGIHSNIPECCVNYYITKLREGHKHIGYVYRRDYYNGTLRANYVVCDECDQKIREGTLVANTLHMCNRMNMAAECKSFFQDYDES